MCLYDLENSWLSLPLPGLLVWDAHRNLVFITPHFIAFFTADGPGMTYINGLVGHSGLTSKRLAPT